MQIGFSPCPNDTFIFYAMLHNKVDMEGLTFEPYISDVEDLNRKAFAEEIPVTKLSFHTYFALQDKYKLLSAGSALGSGCGPLLISKHTIAPDEVKNKVVAIPGKLTTANFLLHSFFPVMKEKKEMVFSEIESALLNETVEAGVIIHENRFTYQLKGLKKIVDLGELWEQTTKHAIPLGGIVVNRNQPEETQGAINRVMKRSVEYAWANQDKVMPYVKHYSQAMSEDVMWQHIKLYVNDFTTDLDEEGKDAVRFMQQYEVKGGFIKEEREDIFIS